MNEPKQIIHIRIRDLRRKHALTQEELAAALGLSRQSINAMEAGRCLPSLPVALQIASYFSVPLAAVFDLPQAKQLMQLTTEQVQPKNNQETPMSKATPWSPLREMREALDEMMDESSSWQMMPAITAPVANIYQNTNQVIVELALPGFQKEQLSIEVGDDFVMISGEVAEDAVDPNHYFRREFVKRSFRRTISLPALVESGRAEAQMKHGILMIVIPKLVEEKPKTAKISISSAE